jgi:hypothetical protein
MLRTIDHKTKYTLGVIRLMYRKCIHIEEVQYTIHLRIPMCEVTKSPSGYLLALASAGRPTLEQGGVKVLERCG